MRCIICRQADTAPGNTTVTLDREGATLVFKDVPAQVCPNCGEAYIDERITGELLRTADGMVRAGIQVDVRRFPLPA
jgi:YgiT-type zinc finger domain-containing protein